AVTHPFPLFSPEAVRIMRAEIAKPEVRSDHHFTRNLATSQLHGYAQKHAPFTYAAWNHAKTVGIVSKLAGIDLVPWGDYEIAHINLSSCDQAGPSTRASEMHSPSPEGQAPIVSWHTDSYPFVCVLMLSDCTTMVGGETALRTAHGEIIRIQCPIEGCAVILQGRHVVHQASRPPGGQERITAVTSWRPRSAFVKDESVLTTVRPVSNINELYVEFVAYRLEIVKERMTRAQTKMRARRQTGYNFDTPGYKAILQDLIHFINLTDQQLIAEEEVKRGIVDDLTTGHLTC
ncbi:hypothetical protein EK21DRAFT_83034, partial [Setomelanomma holmii]